jgi:hypothetical protein
MKDQLPIVVWVKVCPRQWLIAQFWSGGTALSSTVLQYPLFKGPISLL